MMKLLKQAEHAEITAFLDLCRALPAELRGKLGLEIAEVGGNTLVSCEGSAVLLNRAFGNGDLAGAIDDIIRHYKDRGIDRFLLHAYEDQTTWPLLRSMARHSIARYPRGWVKLARDASPPQPTRAPLGLDVRRATGDDRRKVADLYCSSFDLPPAFAPAVAALIGRDNWHVMVASAGSRVAAFGMLFLDGDTGYLAGGGTDPEFRRRGAQSALIAARLSVASSLGVDRIFTETGEAVPGDPQHSYRNLERHGFQPIGIRHNWAPREMSWGHGREAVNS